MAGSGKEPDHGQVFQVWVGGLPQTDHWADAYLTPALSWEITAKLKTNLFLLFLSHSPSFS
jgi:hypothetical protein